MEPDTIGPILESKIAAQKVLDAAKQVAARFTSTDNIQDRILADIEVQIAFDASLKADLAYDAAIKEYVKKQREARNASA